jgi:tetratricopeptide (TPR) repeat protein
MPQPRGPAFRFDPFAQRVKVEAEARLADPAKEAARLVAVGRAAFEAGEYGRALDQFERASAAEKKLAAPHFLKGQAAFAAGRYADAVAAIRAGLDLDPAWPASTFDPKEPYGANAAAFAGHLAELRKVVAANPGEPTLQFLLGYQLWFVGEKAESSKWFDLAAHRLDAPGPLEFFK